MSDCVPSQYRDGINFGWRKWFLVRYVGEKERPVCLVMTLHRTDGTNVSIRFGEFILKASTSQQRN